MTGIDVPGTARTGMGGAKGFRLRPRFEGGPALPDGVRGVEREGVGLRTLQEMELDEAGNGRDVAVAATPHGFEVGLTTASHLKTIHGDKHISVSIPPATQLRSSPAEKSFSARTPRVTMSASAEANLQPGLDRQARRRIVLEVGRVLSVEDIVDDERGNLIGSHLIGHG